MQKSYHWSTSLQAFVFKSISQPYMPVATPNGHLVIIDNYWRIAL